MAVISNGATNVLTDARVGTTFVIRELGKSSAEFRGSYCAESFSARAA